jgi:DNA-binding NarL/FixJ family response regulator
MDTELDSVHRDGASTRGIRDRTIRVAIAMEHALARSALSQLVTATDDLALALDPADADVLVIDLDSGATAQSIAAASNDSAVVGLTASVTPDRIVQALRDGVACVVSTATPPDDLPRAIRLAAAGEMYFDGRIANVLVSQLRAHAKPAQTDDRRDRFAELSEREQTVLRLVAEGRSGPEIGRLLGITAKTVDTYRHRIHEKIGLMHRRDYIHFALQIGLLGA